MRKLLVIFLLIPFGLEAQQIERSVVASAGGYFTNSANSHSISWTLGEVAIQTFTSGSVILTQGFQQGGSITSGVDYVTPSGGSITMYPNPVASTLTIKFSQAPSGVLDVICYDITGRAVASRRFEGCQHEVAFPAHDLSAGVYIIRVMTGAKLLFTGRVVKE